MKWNSFQASALTALLVFNFQIYAEIGGVVVQPSVNKANTEAASNEFPRMVGTLRQDDSGFELSWNNTSDGFQNLTSSLGNVLCKLDILGLFVACNNQSEAVDATSAALQKKQDKYHEIAELSHHHPQVDIVSADEMSPLVTSKIKSQSTEAINNNLVAAKSDDDDGDWRKNRQWWQRGTPVL